MFKGRHRKKIWDWDRRPMWKAVPLPCQRTCGGWWKTAVTRGLRLAEHPRSRRNGQPTPAERKLRPGRHAPPFAAIDDDLATPALPVQTPPSRRLMKNSATSWAAQLEAAPSLVAIEKP